MKKIITFLTIFMLICSQAFAVSTSECFDTDAAWMLHMDGADTSTTFTDSSVNSVTFTAVGNAQIDTAQSKFGGASGLFDGAGDRLTGGSGTEQDLGTGDFTIDFWVRFNSVASIQGFLGADNGSTDWINMAWETSNQINLGLETENFTFAWTPTTNTWYHLALTREGTNLKMFVDGSQIGTTQTSSANIANDGSNAYVGREEQVSGGELNGWMDELRIVAGTAIWTTTFTPPTSAYTDGTGSGCPTVSARGMIMVS